MPWHLPQQVVSQSKIIYYSPEKLPISTNTQGNDKEVCILALGLHFPQPGFESP